MEKNMLDYSALMSDKNKIGSSFEKIPYFTPKNGKTYIHILPPTSKFKEQKPYVVYNLHYIRNEDNYNIPHLCPKTFDPDAPCPICEMKKEMEEHAERLEQTAQNRDDIEKMTELRKRSESLRYTTRVYYNAVVIENFTVEDGGFEPKVLNIPKTCHAELLNEILRDIDAGNNPVAYKQGAIFEIERTGEKFSTKYHVRLVTGKRHDLPESLEKTHESRINLDNLYKVESYAELARAIGKDVSDNSASVNQNPTQETQTAPVGVVKEESQAPAQMVNEMKKDAGSNPPSESLPPEPAPSSSSESLSAEEARKFLDGI